MIAKVTQPTEWCSAMVMLPKSNNRIRICVDLTRLNRCVKQERHPLPGINQTLAQLAGAKLFTKLDANLGFWQIPLSPDSALLTIFIIPFGRYHFRRLPFGSETVDSSQVSDRDSEPIEQSIESNIELHELNGQPNGPMSESTAQTLVQRSCCSSQPPERFYPSRSH